MKHTELLERVYNPGRITKGQIINMDDVQRLKPLPVFSVINIIIIVCPFFYYGWFICHNLIPFEIPDAFAQLWRQPFNLYYLAGRSLTQRIIFSFCFLHLGIISIIQLSIYLMTAAALYFLFSRKGNLIYNLLLSVTITFVFSSYTLNLSAVIIAPEPIFICVLLIFPCILFLHSGRHKDFGELIIFLIGVLFIFSKNVAPYICILLLVFRLITASNISVIKASATYVILLTVIAVASLLATLKYDTSTHVNLLSNAYKRIFPYPDVTSHFHKKYDMPVGPFVEQCKGKWVGAPCFGYHIAITNPKTRNYALSQDHYGFVKWVETKGQRAYLQYLLFDDPKSTHSEFKKAFKEYNIKKDPILERELDRGQRLQFPSIRFMTSYLGWDIPKNSPNNLKSIMDFSPQREVGFLGFDSLAVMHNILIRLGFANVEVIYMCILVGLILIRICHFTSYLSLATSMLASSLGLFFLCYFGDAGQISRHILPALLLFTLGGSLYLLSLLEILLHQVRSKAKGKQTNPTNLTTEM